MSEGRSVAKQALVALEQMRERVEAAERAAREPIAIVGLGLRFPGANGPEAFWDLLSGGVDATSEIPPDRWDVDAFYDPDPDAAGMIYTKRGAFLADIDAFDAEFFGVSPREARSMDPQHRLLFEVAWEALEHAGVAPARLGGSRTGVFVGITLNDYLPLMAAAGHTRSIDQYAHHGNVLNAAAGRLSFALGFQGPSLAVDTACSSSLVAAHLACQSLRARDCDVALAGGVNLILSPTSSIRLARGRMLAPDGRCKAFDARADGYSRGEGCGIVVLKRLSAAQTDGDRILAVIRGSAVNQDGRTSGPTVPNGLAQRALIREALANASVAPAEVSYLEAHGTGTELGDPIEMDALADVLGAGRREPLRVGSVKTNIGHLESASGVAGLIKVVLALQHDAIPAHLHFHTPSPHIAWSEIPVAVPTRMEPWPAATRRVAGVSSFGASGTNAHVVVEEAPAPRQLAGTRADTLCVLALSGESDAALRELSGRYRRFLDAHTEVAAADVCCTAAIGRSHFTHRAAVVGTDRITLRDGTASVAADPAAPVLRGVVARDRTAKIAFLFTGQGSQYAGMARELFETEPAFRSALEECDRALAAHLDIPLLTLLYGSSDESTRIDRTAYAQPALFSLEYALARLLESWGVAPAVVIGHSIGEFTAACVAGALSVADAAALVAARGRLMQALPEDGAMVAITASEEAVGAALARHADRVAIAAINAPDQIVLSGDRAALDTLLDALAVPDDDRRWLQVSHAFHSPLVAPMLEPFGRAAASIRPSSPQIPFVSNVTGRALTGALDADYWVRHARSPVRFADGIKQAADLGCSVFVEVGPTPTLLSLAQRSVNSADITCAPTLRRGKSDREQMARALGFLYVAGAHIDWRAVHAGTPARRIALPTYPFARDRYWFEPREATAARRSAVAPGPVGAATDGTQSGDDVRAYEIAWRRAELPTPPDAASPSRPYVVLTTETGIGAAMVASLARQGRPYFEVKPGVTFERTGPTAFTVRPASRADLEAVCRTVDDEVGEVAAVVHAWGAERPADAPSLGWFREYWQASCGSLVHLVQALARIVRHAPRLFVVTSGATASDPAFHQGALWGIARTIAREHPELRCSLIDADSPVDAALADSLIAEIDADTADDQVAYGGGGRRVARLVARNLPPPAARIEKEATYIVTGGLGAAGFAVAEWLASQGAGHIALFNRRAPSAEMLSRIEALELCSGVRLHAMRVDVADRAHLSSALDELARTLPPVRGIVHAAGALADGMLADLDWPRFELPLEAKAYGAWHLHELTRDLPLDFFVMFSSFAALAGSAGQANYAAANALLDALAHHRRAHGRPATSIAWGPWKIGMLAALDAAHRDRWTRQGLELLDPNRACSALAAAIAADAAHLAIVDIDWPRFAASGRRTSEPFLDELAPSPVAAAAATVAADLLAEVAAAPLTRRRAVVVDAVEQHARVVLGAESGKRIDVDRPLRELGLDSLMALELRNAVAARLGRPLPATLLFDYPTVGQVADFLLRSFLADEPSSMSPPPDRALQEHDIDEIERLSAEEAESLLLAELNASED